MPRPQTKTELISLSQSNFNKLIDYVDFLPKAEQERNFPKGTLNRNIGDVFAHLHQWHLMMMDWYRVGMQGEKSDIPATGYTWKTLPELNKAIQKQYRQTAIGDARLMLIKSFKEIQKLIAKHSEEELFEKKRYKWTGSTSLGAYLISNTSSHYDWAYKLIKNSKNIKIKK